MNFKLWLEFEEWVYESEKEKDKVKDIDSFIMEIHLSNGKNYSLEVWPIKYLDLQLKEIKESELKYLSMPDLIVDEMNREKIERYVKDIIANNELKNEWLEE